MCRRGVGWAQIRAGSELATLMMFLAVVFTIGGSQHLTLSAAQHLTLSAALSTTFAGGIFYRAYQRVACDGALLARTLTALRRRNTNTGSVAFSRKPSGAPSADIQQPLTNQGT